MISRTAFRPISRRSLPALIISLAWALLANAQDASQYRPIRDDSELRRWLVNMLVYHRFTPEEAGVE